MGGSGIESQCGQKKLFIYKEEYGIKYNIVVEKTFGDGHIGVEFIESSLQGSTIINVHWII